MSSLFGFSWSEHDINGNYRHNRSQPRADLPCTRTRTSSRLTKRIIAQDRKPILPEPHLLLSHHLLPTPFPRIDVLHILVQVKVELSGVLLFLQQVAIVVLLVFISEL